jgi:D-arabinose 1-dehydrogenase-like Zn-dependent alcohol dehydrogenase
MRAVMLDRVGKPLRLAERPDPQPGPGGDEAGQAFARRLGVDWVGGSDQLPPQPLDAAIIFAPVGALVPAALRAVRKGGRVVSTATTRSTTCERAG